MARTIDGTSSILRAARTICRMTGRFGTAQLGTRVSPEFRDAVGLLVTACMAFDALDDFPGEIDATLPFGVEDVGGIPE